MHDTELEGRTCHLPVIQSELLACRFRHGFTTRHGGVSHGPFASLNLGGRWGDDPAAVAENHRRLRDAGAGGVEVHFGWQVHGAEVAVIAPGQPAATTGSTRADAVLTASPGVALGVLAADCVPILVGNVVTGACAAVHSGWRGAVAGVLEAALRRLLDLPGARVHDLRVAIGPSIGPCCFEVGPEVVAEVEVAFGAVARQQGAIRARGARPPQARDRQDGQGRQDGLQDALQDGLQGQPKEHVDLWRLAVLAARNLGVSGAHIDAAEQCTACTEGRFFSYRRDRGRTGLQAAVIVAP
jgi:YfiH family protein